MHDSSDPGDTEQAPIDSTEPQENASPLKQLEELAAQLMDFERHQGKQFSFTLLLITIAIFFSAGIITATVEEILILVGVLLVHELGHLLAMKLLGYRDVRMFFIPFFGAAVSGRSARNSSARSSVVSLMGPLPGLVAGTALYFVFALTRSYYVLKTAQVMLFLNAMNLLPIMPLDGGRYIDVLFVRNRIFRFLFALLGVAFFLLLALGSRDVVLAILALFGLMGALTSLKVNTVAAEATAEGLTVTSMPELLHDMSALQSLLAKLQKRFPRMGQGPSPQKVIHGYLTQVLDTLRFVPAGIAARVGFVLLYLIVLMPSLAVTLMSVWMNYSEQLRVTYVEGQRVAMLDSHSFGRRACTIPLDSNNLLHGTGYGYGFDTSFVQSQFVYEHGYRTGVWFDFDTTGDTTRFAWYSKGRLDSVRQKSGEQWETLRAGRFAAYRRLIETIREASQPRRSHHERYREGA